MVRRRRANTIRDCLAAWLRAMPVNIWGKHVTLRPRFFVDLVELKGRNKKVGYFSGAGKISRYKKYIFCSTFFDSKISRRIDALHGE